MVWVIEEQRGLTLVALHRPDQVMSEVSGFLQMLNDVYDVFGLDYELALSTRPEKYLGEIEVWNKAEGALTEALNSTGREWKVRRSVHRLHD